MTADRLDPSEFLTIDTWASLAQELGLPYAEAESAIKFMEDNRPRLMLSGRSDLTLALQADHHPNNDLGKLALGVNWEEPGAVRDRYVGVRIGPACVEEKCVLSHRFSLRTDRFTWETFDDIPEGTRWRVTNLDVEHPRMGLLPFGLNTDGPGLGILKEMSAKRPHKHGGIYVNFQDNTVDRVMLKRHYDGVSGFTLRKQANLGVADYLEDVAGHEFVLCPAGNGLDCYRVWETLYLGSLPVLKDSVFARTLLSWGLPVLVVPSLFGLTPRGLYALAYSQKDRGMERARLSFWRKTLEEEA